MFHRQQSLISCHRIKVFEKFYCAKLPLSNLIFLAEKFKWLKKLFTCKAIIETEFPQLFKINYFTIKSITCFYCKFRVEDERVAKLKSRDLGTSSTETQFQKFSARGHRFVLTLGFIAFLLRKLIYFICPDNFYFIYNRLNTNTQIEQFIITF